MNEKYIQKKRQKSMIQAGFLPKKITVVNYQYTNNIIHHYYTAMVQKYDLKLIYS